MDQYVFKSSPWAAWLLASFFVLSLIVLWTASVPFWVHLGLSLAAGYQVIRCLPLLGYGYAASDIVAMRYQLGVFQMVQRDGVVLPATIYGDSVVTTSCLLLRARVRDHNRLVWVLSGMLPSVQYKRLLMQLRFSIGGATHP